MKKKHKFMNYCFECSGIFMQSIHVFFQLLRGGWKISRLPVPRVTFFGGSRWKKHDYYTQQAYLLAQELAKAEISIMTGGGPGIMEAGNCGAAAVSKKENYVKSIGIGVSDLPREEGINMCAQEFIIFDNFFVRKWLLINYSVGFVFFPGGYGTVDELGTILTMIETKKVSKVPIILIGKDFWKEFVDWSLKMALENKTITLEESKLFIVTDNIQEAASILVDFCKKFKNK